MIRNPAAPVDPSFWAAITGLDASGLWFDWIAVEPAAGTNTIYDPWSFTDAQMWLIREPYTAGWGNLREANGSKGIDPGTVVRIQFAGYIPAPSGASPSGTGSPDPGNDLPVPGSFPIAGTSIDASGINSLSPSGAIPFYVFQYRGADPDPVVPIHDHRDNVTGGGFAFAVWHPGTALPQQPWYL
jgi:hypothetical protein